MEEYIRHFHLIFIPSLQGSMIEHNSMFVKYQHSNHSVCSQSKSSNTKIGLYQTLPIPSWTWEIVLWTFMINFPVRSFAESETDWDKYTIKMLEKYFRFLKAFQFSKNTKTGILVPSRNISQFPKTSQAQTAAFQAENSKEKHQKCNKKATLNSWNCILLLILIRNVNESIIKS